MTLTIKNLANADVTLTKINQDAYSGEYFKRDAANRTEYRVKVRHSNETPKPGTLPMVRHNVELTVTTFPVDGTAPVIYQAYFVLRSPLSGDDTAFGYIVGNLAGLLEGADLTRLLGWDTDLVGAGG